MKHIHIDEFAKLKSPLHGLDPRAKAVSFFAFIFITVTLTNPYLLLSAVIFWAVILMWAGIPAFHVVQRVAWVIPFAGVLIILFPFITPGVVIWTFDAGIFSFSATAEGFAKAVTLLLRVMASVLALITLMSTTRFTQFMKALAYLKVPHVILHMIEFTIRYIFVTLDEVKRMKRARKSRGFRAGKNLWNGQTIKTLAQMIGLLFIRSYERGDRVYLAMLSRGFRGSINTINEFAIRPQDIAGAAAIILLALTLLVLDKGGLV